MRLAAFRVENYRNIEDSGWVELDRVTALVGRNESGKTTRLKALHKFNPATPEPYDGQRDFPRDRYTTDFRDPAQWRVCTARFELAGDVADRIAALLPTTASAPNYAECRRYYDGSLTISFDPAISLASVPPTDVADALKKFAAAARRLEAPKLSQEKSTQEKRTKLAQWAQAVEQRMLAHADLRSAAGVAVLRAVRSEVDEHSGPQTADMVEALQAAIDSTLPEAEWEDPTSEAEEVIEQAMPVFIYFENYGILDSAVWLPRFLEDTKVEPNNPRVRTINAMFRHVGLSADDLMTLGRDRATEMRMAPHSVYNPHVHQQPPRPEITAEIVQADQRRKEERAIKLSSASSAITRRFGEWWSQRRHKIRYDADGDFFRIWVSDNRRPDVEIELESRSKGFQWFFSFYLVFLVESEDGHKDAVLLLDEPGLNLHPTAQQELLSFFETLSERNQLVFSTHSPFLIDGENLQRIRAVVEGEDGHSQISKASMWPKDRETIFPLQAAAGYAMLRGLFSTRDNLLVEGMTDFYLLSALSPKCRAAGLPSLSESIHIVPCGGVPMVGKLAAIFLGENVRPLVLLDGDKAGRQSRNVLVNDFYRGHDAAILLIDDVLGGEGKEVEDLLGEEVFLKAVNKALHLTLTLNDNDLKETSIVKAIASAAKRAGKTLPDAWKVTSIMGLVGDWAERRVDCPSGVIERTSSLFEAINERFSTMDRKVA